MMAALLPVPLLFLFSHLLSASSSSLLPNTSYSPSPLPQSSQLFHGFGSPQDSSVAALTSSRHLTGNDLEYFGTVTTLAGMAGVSFGSANGVGTHARFYDPHGVTISPDRAYALVADTANHLIRHIIVSTASVTSLAGLAGSGSSTNGLGTISRFNRPAEVVISPDGVYALVADLNTHSIRHIIVSTASVTSLAGFPGSSGFTNGIGTHARFNGPTGVAISPDGVYALVADYSNQWIRHIIISSASVTDLAGERGVSGSINGIGTGARFHNPTKITISPDGVYALVADRSQHLIRHIIISTASVTTLAGFAATSGGSTNGIGTNARFNGPTGVTISPDGFYALVADEANHLIRQIIISTATVTTLAGVAGSSGFADGQATNSRFHLPCGVYISPNGLYALIADRSNHQIRKIVSNLMTASPSPVPSAPPTLSPTRSLHPTFFSFGVRLNDNITRSAILLDYVQDIGGDSLSFPFTVV